MFHGYIIFASINTMRMWNAEMTFNGNDQLIFTVCWI